MLVSRVNNFNTNPNKLITRNKNVVNFKGQQDDIDELLHKASGLESENKLIEAKAIYLELLDSIALKVAKRLGTPEDRRMILHPKMDLDRPTLLKIGEIIANINLTLVRNNGYDKSLETETVAVHKALCGLLVRSTLYNQLSEISKRSHL